VLLLTRFTSARAVAAPLALTLIAAAACTDRVPTSPNKTPTQRASTDINPSPSLFDSLYVTPVSVNAGDVALGTIVLHQPAPFGGAHILLRNYNYRVATWDSNLVVPQGFTRMNFAIQTNPTVPTNLGDQIDAYWAGSHISAMFGVMFVPAPGITVTPTAIGWGAVALGNATSGRVVKITNTGNVQVTVSSLTLGGANPGDFPISDGCTGASLTPTSWLYPGGSCMAYVSFEPQRIGARTATITITHSAGAPKTVSLSGTGSRGGGGWVP